MSEKRAKYVRVRATRAIAVQDETGAVRSVLAGERVVVDANDEETKPLLGDALVEDE
jgi:hypothetical protein